MQLDRLVIETRVRSGWSAIDLGIVLGRSFWLRSFCLYLLFALPVYGLTRLVPNDLTYLPYFLLWWMKPLFERPILFLLSRELFSESMTFWQVVRAFGLWFKPGILWIVTFRRLSFLRGMYAPITLLEAPGAKAYAKRASVLGSKLSGEAFWLTIVLFHIEAFIFFAIIAFFKIIAPELIDLTSLFPSDTREYNVYLDIISTLVVAGIAPFYVASGFMLYISRRVELEGWDIEICFRDWMAKYQGNLSGKDEERKGASL